MRHILPIKIALVLTPLTAGAQHIGFPAHDLQRGYYDAPYLRYEAEPGMCVTDGDFLNPPVPYSQQPLQAEASNLTALELSGKDSFVSWTVDEPANAMTLRFSIPDSDDGMGLRTNVDVYADERKIATVTLDSYWSWQYTPVANSNEKYPDRTPSDSKFARMRFDEINTLFDSRIEKGSSIKIIKTTDDGIPVTIDFIELELAGNPLTADDFPNEDVAVFSGKGSTLESFIRANAGKRILIAPGTYEIPSGLTITSDNTRISGSGMWHTTLHFTADPDSRMTFGDRGITCEANRVELSDMSVTTTSRMRYWPGKSNIGSGKGLMGSWGKDSKVSRVRVDHFECGAWIADYAGRQMENLEISHCRFRNNYADGINLCQGTTGGKVTHCSFRNNGDDDMATWSAGNWAKNHEYAWNTAENNWRASSLGIFGGECHRAHHLLVIDAMEAGIRANGNFGGTGFSENGECSMTDITIIRSGCISGTPGTQGGFWGDQQGAVDVQAGGQYGVTNLRLENIDIHSSRNHGVRFSSSNSKSLKNIQIHNIRIDGHGETGWAVCCENNCRGDGDYSNISFGENTSRRMSEIPAAFDFRGEFLKITNHPAADRQTLSVEVSSCGCVSLKGLNEGSVAFITDTTGNIVASDKCSENGTLHFEGIPNGIYITWTDGLGSKKFVIAK